jgi:hypothetical protein
LRGAHLQSAQSAYQRACIGLTPAEIEQARSFAQSWRPCPPTGPTMLGPRQSSEEGSGANSRHEQALLASPFRLQARSTAFQTAGAAEP